MILLFLLTRVSEPARIEEAERVLRNDLASLIEQPKKWRTIPDTVDEFTGFFIEVDLWAWDSPDSVRTQRYVQNGWPDRSYGTFGASLAF